MSGDCGYDMREGEENFFTKKVSSPSHALPHFSKNTGRSYRWKFLKLSKKLFSKSFLDGCRAAPYVTPGLRRGEFSPLARAYAYIIKEEFVTCAIKEQNV